MPLKLWQELSAFANPAGMQPDRIAAPPIELPISQAIQEADSDLSRITEPTMMADAKSTLRQVLRRVAVLEPKMLFCQNPRWFGVCWQPPAVVLIPE
jgi:hypothetical protein